MVGFQISVNYQSVQQYVIVAMLLKPNNSSLVASVLVSICKSLFNSLPAMTSFGVAVFYSFIGSRLFLFSVHSILT